VMPGCYLIALLVASGPALAQTPQVYIDLSGPWTRAEAGKPAGTMSLPRHSIVSEPPFHLERSVRLPAEGLDGLSLLMSPLGSGYLVKVNGTPVGGLRSSHPWWAVPETGVVLPLPDGLLHEGENRIEVEAEGTREGDPLLAMHSILPFISPALGEAGELRGLAEGQRSADQLAHFYLPVNASIQLLFAAILIGMSRGSRYRKALLWMALYFFWVALFFDLLLTLEIFGGISRTPRVWLMPINQIVWVIALTEASLALVGYSPPAWLRVAYYGSAPLYTRGGPASAYIRLVVDGLLLGLAIRRQNRLAIRFQAILIGYDLLTVAIAPPFLLPGLLQLGPLGFHVIPGYRVLIGLALILIVVLQSSKDRNERERLAGELEAARTLQQELLPDATQGDVQGVYRPAAEVGGDFWQVLPALDGRGQLIAIGDVSGKGLRAAMVVSMLIGALRNRKSDRPAAILAELNQVAASALNGGFVTASVALIEGEQVIIANAGHPEPYQDGREVSLKAGLPLGVDREFNYEECYSLLTGKLTFVTDGVIEAADSKRELFGFQRTREISTLSAREIADAARAWGQNDDITVVTVRRGDAR